MSAAVQGWVETEAGDALRAVWARELPGQPVPRVFECGGLRAIVAREPVGPDYDEPDLRWHVSITHVERVPTWGELVDAAHALRPGVVFCVPMPPRSWWLNVHPHALHLWEIGDLNLVNQWRSERRGDTPT